MYRVVQLGMKWYAYQIESVEDDAENIETFVAEGSLVLLVDNLDDAQEITGGDVEVVE